MPDLLPIKYSSSASSTLSTPESSLQSCVPIEAKNLPNQHYSRAKHVGTYKSWDISVHHDRIPSPIYFPLFLRIRPEKSTADLLQVSTLAITYPGCKGLTSNKLAASTFLAINPLSAFILRHRKGAPTSSSHKMVPLLSVH